jgi:methylmalonyl-CoA mutase cobalamin-binding subunit
MKRLGVAAVFQPGTSLQAIVEFIRSHRRERHAV